MVKSEFNHQMRIDKVRAFVEENNLDYILFTNIQNIYWLTGTGQYGVLLFDRINEPILFIRRNIFRAKEESNLEEIIELKKTSQIKDHLKNENKTINNLKIGMELDSLPASYYMNYKSLFDGAKIENVELDLRKLRMIKDEKELVIHRKAGIISQKSIEKIPEVLKLGIKENEIAAHVMCHSIKNKSMHFCNVNSIGNNWFIIASGKNLWTPSTFPVLSGSGYSNAVPICYSDRVIEKGDIVMCDYGLQYKGYHSDHARTFFLEPIPERFKERYLILKHAYLETVEEYLRDGNPVSLIYNKMKELIEKQDKSLVKYLQGDGYYFQGLGHGVGLELDEPPYILPNNNIVLKENMVLALEPKIIIPNWGAIDFEDVFIIKSGKPERITKTNFLF